MEAAWDIVILVLVIFGLMFFGLAVYALYWAAKNGQFEQFEKASRAIFDDEEPEGVLMDTFPKKRIKNRNHT